MPADTVLKMLENNGVKPDELKYTGLADLLREKGQEKVSPDEVKKFLDANNLQVQEVTHLPVSDEEMSRRIASGEGNISGKPTRFGSYTLPGGSNYREMLLTLPKEPKAEDLLRSENRMQEIRGQLKSIRDKYDPLISQYQQNGQWDLMQKTHRQQVDESEALSQELRSLQRKRYRGRESGSNPLTGTNPT